MFHVKRCKRGVRPGEVVSNEGDNGGNQLMRPGPATTFPLSVFAVRVAREKRRASQSFPGNRVCVRFGGYQKFVRVGLLRR